MATERPGDDLDAMFDATWELLVQGAADRRAALHLPVVVSIGPDGPDARVMVLRGVDRARHSLRFHTDRRAMKAAHIAIDPRVGIVGYDADARLQLRLHGVAVVHSGAEVAAYWATTETFGRRAYRTTLPPGSPLAAPGSGLPPEFERVAAGDPLSEAGRDNFAVLEVALDRIEWLLLAHSGHRRAVHCRTGDDWHGEWRVP